MPHAEGSRRGYADSINADRRSRMVEAAVACAFAVSMSELQAPSRRSADAAFARQAAMYLAHVAFGLTFTQVGRAFQRDRTTAAHACRRVEDRRDDPIIDARLTALEHALTSQATEQNAGSAAAP